MHAHTLVAFTAVAAYFISHGGGPWPWPATRVHHESEFFGGITVSSYRLG